VGLLCRLAGNGHCRRRPDSLFQKKTVALKDGSGVTAYSLTTLAE
jgi:hypothetical protein